MVGARVVESCDEAAQHVTESFFFQEMLERAISPSHALPKDLSFARHLDGFRGGFRFFFKLWYFGVLVLVVVTFC